MELDVLAILPLWLAIFLFSTTCHEAAHALAAQLGGDLTAHAGGQVSLDPTPHVRRHPMGMVAIPILVFLLNSGQWMVGWASAPYDPVWAARHPRRAAWMSLAGPAANLALVLVAAVAIYTGVFAGVLEAPKSPTTDHVVALAGGGQNLGTLALSVTFTLNLLLFSFNLLPIPPLDGSGVLGLFLPQELHQKWLSLFSEPIFAIVGFVVSWQAFSYVWNPLFLLGLRVLYPDTIYVRG